MTVRPLAVDVVSDVVCPWCYVGKRRLERALALVPDLTVTVRWRPFQLDATIPATGLPRRDYLTRKFGSAAEIERLHAPLRALGEAEGIPFVFDRIAVAPNTLNAHRVIRWAAADGVQDSVVERLFQLYFTAGADLSDDAVLADAAADAGMDRAVIARLLAGDADRAEVTAEIAEAHRIGITGVPAFLIAARYAVVGAREPDIIAEALRRAAAEGA